MRSILRSPGRLLAMAGLSMTLPLSAQVFITEVADPNNSAGSRFVEFYNAGAAPVDLTGWTLQIYSNGSGTPSATNNLTGSIPAGGFFILADNNTTFSTTFGFAADQDGVVNGNGNDTYVLNNAVPAVVDIFGSIGVDGVGTCADIEDGRAERVAAVTMGNATFTESEWNVWNDGPSGAVCTSIIHTAQDAPGGFDPGIWIGAGGPSCGISLGTASAVCNSQTAGPGNDTYDLSIPYTGSEAGITVVNNSGSGTIGGDDPAVTTDGTIVISGISEDNAYSVTFTSPCDALTLSGAAPSCEPAPSVDLVINEILADPDATLGDANGDGVVSTTNDEFVEIVNSGVTDVDISNWTLSDGVSVRHTFPAGSVVSAGCAVVVFAGGTPTGGFGGALVQIASTGSLSLNNAGDAVTLSDAFANVIATYTYGSEGGNNESLTRDPDITGAAPLVAHSTATGSGGALFSPGTLVHGSSFSGCTPPPSCGITLGAASAVCNSQTAGPGNDTYDLSIPYTGLEAGTTVVNNSGSGTIGGDDPAVTSDGTIVISGISEDDAYSVTFTSPCDALTLSGAAPSCEPAPSVDLVVNEILADPDATLGDANGDGVVSATDDEFIEIVNNGASDVDMSNWSINDGFGLRHTFPAGSVVSAGCAVVVFGGGTPIGGFGGALVQTASTGSLGLNNGGDDVTLIDEFANVIVTYTYGSEGGNNESLTRDPDITGAAPLVAHSTATGSGGALFSPGTLVDGSSFSGCTPPPSCGISLGAPSAVCNSQTAGPGNDTYDLSIPYTGLEAGITVVNNSGSGTIGGDDPAVTTDGTIVISGISEDDAYSVTFTSPCDILLVSGTAPSCEPPFAGTVIDFDDDLLWTAGSAAIGSYASDHTYVDSDWSFTGGPALRQGTAIQDGVPGALDTYAWRLQNAGGVDWRATYQGGDILENFGFSVRRWDGSPSPAFEVSFSTDGGASFGAAVAVIDNAFLDNSSAWKVFSHTLASPAFVFPGQFVVRVVSTGTTERIMIDDFTFESSPGPACPLALENIPNFDENTCACELGYFATITDIGGNDVITACTICPPGSFCPDGLEAQPCAAGTFSADIGAIACNSCSAGTFSAVTGSTSCTACPAGTFNPNAGATECLACPAGETSGEGAIECVPAGPCSDYILELRSDAGDAAGVTYEVLDATGTTTLLSGNNPFPASSVGTLTLCLPDGCYQLRVTDAAGDGLLGYVLRLTGTDGARIIDNTLNMVDGVSQIGNGPAAFCLPIAADPKPIFALRDKEDFTSGEYLVSEEVAAVSALWIESAPNSAQSSNTGYQFWIFDPNGSYSFRRFRSHNVSDGYANVGATRACHMKINNWDAVFHIPEDVLMNVRIRPRVNGTYGEFGPAYRFKIDPVAAACPQTKLLDFPGNPNISCNETFAFGPGNYVYARPVTGANRYQFRFRITAEGYTRVRTSNNYILELNWGFQPLEDGKTYDVDVRVSKDGGATWCASGPQWGDNCKVTISGSGAQGETQNLAIGQGDGTLSMWPNPNRSEQLWLGLTGIEQGVSTVAIDIFDLAGKRLVAREIATSFDSAQDGGRLYTVLDLNGELAAGTYLVTITAGDQRYTERLVIAR